MAYNVGVTRAKVEAGTAALVYDPTNTPNDLVRECQNMLKALKNNSGAYYYTGTADGKYGTGMKNAVRTFQERLGVWRCRRKNREENTCGAGYCIRRQDKL